VALAALLWLRLWPFSGGRVLALGAMSWAVTGLHAGLMPAPMPGALEGRDLDVQALVEAMVQRQDSGLRLRVRIEQATLDGQPVQVPERVVLGWYAASARDDGLAPPLPEVQPGERWRWRVRLKAAHGHLNPGGLDVQEWLWEQGVRRVLLEAGPQLLSRHLEEGFVDQLRVYTGNVMGGEGPTMAPWFTRLRLSDRLDREVADDAVLESFVLPSS